MNRRDFIGSTVGILAATKMPFIARLNQNKLISLPSSEEERQALLMKFVINAFPEHIFNALICDDDRIIKGAPLEHSSHINNKASYTFQRINITIPEITLKGTILLWNRQIIAKSPLGGGVQRLFERDALSVTHTIEYVNKGA